MDTFEQMRAPTLPEILASSFENGTCTQRDIERKAARSGHSTLAVEMALNKAERDGVLVRETVFRLADDYDLPSQDPQPAKITPVTPRGPFDWQSTLETLKAMRVGDSTCFYREAVPLAKFAKQFSVYLCQWRASNRLRGRFQYRMRLDLNGVWVARIPG
jgi:hypothetical protein